MIRKIKCDKFKGRKPSEAKSTDYMEKIKREANDFDNIEDIFLAYLIGR